MVIAYPGCAISFSSEGGINGVVHFKVIRVGLDIENMLKIEMFSSGTGERRESTPSLVRPGFYYFHSPHVTL